MIVKIKMTNEPNQTNFDKVLEQCEAVHSFIPGSRKVGRIKNGN